MVVSVYSALKVETSFQKISTYQVFITSRAMGALQLEQTHRMRQQLLKSVSLTFSINKDKN